MILQLISFARDLKVSYTLVKETARLCRLPVVNFAAGGIATPADAALVMNYGCDGVFVGSGIFKAEDPDQRARAIVLATTYYDDPKVVMEAQKMVDERKSLLGLDTKNLGSTYARKRSINLSEINIGVLGFQGDIEENIISTKEALKNMD